MGTDPHLDVRDLRFFLAIGEELHFRRAAERLRVAQPHLSQHIKQLEDRIGVRLLDRTTRSVKLTYAGMQLLERCRFVLAQIDDAVLATRRSAEGRRGNLNIGFTETVSRNILPAVLGQFRRLHPHIDVALSYDGTAGQVEKLVDGRLHFGFLRLPVHTRRLHTLTLAREGLIAALPRDHPLAMRSALALEDLQNEDFIRFSPVLGVDFQEHVLSYCQRAGFTPRAIMEASDTRSILNLVAAGFGVAIVPEYVKHNAYPMISYKPLSEIPPVVDIALAWLPGDPSPAHQAFRDVIADFLRGRMQS